MFAGEASEPRDRPEAAGWKSVATAIHSLRLSSTPTLLTVAFADRPHPLWIDFSTLQYFWELPLADMPSEPGALTVYSQPIEPGDPPYPWVAWRPADPLLWQIGRFAFGTDRATWIRPGERYALQRWPNLTETPHSAEEIRMVASLTNGFLTVEEVGLLGGSDAPNAQRVLNALSLMGAVKTADSAATPPGPVPSAAGPTPPASAPSESGGFLQRLRGRINGGR